MRQDEIAEDMEARPEDWNIATPKGDMVFLSLAAVTLLSLGVAIGIGIAWLLW